MTNEASTETEQPRHHIVTDSRKEKNCRCIWNHESPWNLSASCQSLCSGELDASCLGGSFKAPFIRFHVINRSQWRFTIMRGEFTARKLMYVTPKSYFSRSDQKIVGITSRIVRNRSVHFVHSLRHSSLLSKATVLGRCIPHLRHSDLDHMRGPMVELCGRHVLWRVLDAGTNHSGHGSHHRHPTVFAPPQTQRCIHCTDLDIAELSEVQLPFLFQKLHVPSCAQPAGPLLVGSDDFHSHLLLCRYADGGCSVSLV
jgi:hypothetical protein